MLWPWKLQKTHSHSKNNQNWFRLRCSDHDFSCQEIRSATLALLELYNDKSFELNGQQEGR